MEAIYHRTLHSPTAGDQLFAKHYEHYESKGQLAVCRALVAANRVAAESLPPSDERRNSLRWVRYWESRLARRLGEDGEAAAILQELLVDADADPRLRLWVLSDHGNILQDQKPEQARDVYKQTLAYAETSGADQFNLPVWYGNLAAVHWRLEELDAAADAFQQAIVAAQRVNNPGSEAYSHLNLSGVLQDLGRWREASTSVLTAFDLVRLRGGKNPAIQVALLERAMSLFSYEPALLDTTAKEFEALTGTGNTTDGFNRQKSLAITLRRGGQLRRAEALFAALEQDTARVSDELALADFTFSLALLRESQGRVEEAIELYTSLIGRPSGRPWYAAAAGLNRAALNIKRARWEEVDVDLDAARPAFDSQGYRKLVALAELIRADSLRRKGRLAEAQQLADDTRAVVQDGPRGYLADNCLLHGDIARDQARWDEAEEQYERALTLQLALYQLESAAGTLRKLDSVAAARGRWADAAQYAGRAAQLWQRLAQMNAYEPSEAAKRADKANADGLLKYLSPTSDGNTDAIGEARISFDSRRRRLRMGSGITSMSRPRRSSSRSGPRLPARSKVRSRRPPPGSTHPSFARGPSATICRMPRRCRLKAIDC